MEEEVLWCLGIWAEETDYILCKGDEDLLPKLYKQDEIRFEYNQGANDRSLASCTIFSAMWMLSDLMNVEFSKSNLKDVDDISYTLGRMKDKWRYVKSAVDLVRKRRNENNKDKVAYYRINVGDIMLEDALDKLYTINTNMCPTKEYNADFRKDAMLDGKDFGVNTNWHAIDVIKYKGQRSVKDSYKWRKTYDGKKECNIYGLKHELKDISNFWQWSYIFTKVKEDTLEEVKRLNEIKAKILQGMPINSDLRHLTNSEPYKDKLHETNNMFREWLDYINNELKNLN